MRNLHPSFVLGFLGLVLLGSGCFGSELEVNVRFVGPVRVEEGTPVVYQGVPIGEVENLSLKQSTPRSPAEVTLTLGIENDEIVLREGDRFEIAAEGLMRNTVVRVTPGLGESEPLADGAFVDGVPPLATRVNDSLSEAFDSLGAAASEKAEELMNQIADSLEGFELPEGLPLPTPPEEPGDGTLNRLPKQAP